MTRDIPITCPMDYFIRFWVWNEQLKKLPNHPDHFFRFKCADRISRTCEKIVTKNYHEMIRELFPQKQGLLESVEAIKDSMRWRKVHGEKIKVAITLMEMADNAPSKKERVEARKKTQLIFKNDYQLMEIVSHMQKLTHATFISFPEIKKELQVLSPRHALLKRH